FVPSRRSWPWRRRPGPVTSTRPGAASSCSAWTVTSPSGGTPRSATPCVAGTTSRAISPCSSPTLRRRPRSPPVRSATRPGPRGSRRAARRRTCSSRSCARSRTATKRSTASRSSSTGWPRCPTAKTSSPRGSPSCGPSSRRRAVPADPHPQERPDVDDVLRHLKDFQRRTVDHVHARLWDAADPSHRVLVAAEVGLGKTLVAKGVIAKAVEQLWDTVDRIDVVYICSNQQIARQNLARLTLRGHEPLHAERLTLMPLVTGELAGKKLNFVSFTPGTSLQVTSGGGRALERVVMYWMLARGSQDLDVRPRRWLQFFRDSSSLKTFTPDVERFRRHRMHELDLDFAAEFAEQLSRDRGPRGGKLLDELVECVQ